MQEFDLKLDGLKFKLFLFSLKMYTTIYTCSSYFVMIFLFKFIFKFIFNSRSNQYNSY